MTQQQRNYDHDGDKPGGAIRFGVVDEDRRRSSTYTIRGNRTTDDVYLTPRNLGEYVKVSMHQSGHWHLKFTPGEYEHRLGPPSRKRWSRPEEFADGWTKAFSVVIPTASVRIRPPNEAPLEQKVTWVGAPEERALAVEFTVLILALGTPVSGWPGRTTMRTQLVGSFRLVSGSTVWVVAHARNQLPQPGDDLAVPPPGGDKEAFLQQLRTRPLGSMRILVIGHDDNEWWLMETAMTAKDDPRVPDKYA